MRRTFLAFTICIAVLSVATWARAQDHPIYGAELEGFDYPHDVHRYEFRSQGSDIVHGLHGRETANRQWANRGAACTAGISAPRPGKRRSPVLSKAGFRVIAPDQIGFCKSTKPLGYQFSIQQLATNTNALLTSLGVSRPIVIGHSFGGMTAMRYALMFPDAVEQMSWSIRSGWRTGRRPVSRSSTSTRASRSRRQRPSTASSNTSRGSTTPASGGPNTTAGWRCSPECIAGRAPNALRRCRRGSRRWLFTQPVVHEFERIRVPTLLMIGQLDRTAPGANRAPPELAKELGNYPELGRAAARRIPNAELIEFPELGHAPQIQAPDQFHEALLKSLGGR